MTERSTKFIRTLQLELAAARDEIRLRDEQNTRQRTEMIGCLQRAKQAEQRLAVVRGLLSSIVVAHTNFLQYQTWDNAEVLKTLMQLAEPKLAAIAQEKP